MICRWDGESAGECAFNTISCRYAFARDPSDEDVDVAATRHLTALSLADGKKNGGEGDLLAPIELAEASAPRITRFARPFSRTAEMDAALEIAGSEISRCTHRTNAAKHPPVHPRVERHDSWLPLANAAVVFRVSSCPLSISPNHFEIALRDSAARAHPNLIPLSPANNRVYGVGHDRLTHAAPPDCEIANPKRGA